MMKDVEIFKKPAPRLISTLFHLDLLINFTQLKIQQ